MSVCDRVSRDALYVNQPFSGSFVGCACRIGRIRAAAGVSWASPVLDSGDAGLLVSEKHDALRVSMLPQPPADHGLRVHM
jgi:hypothetical protein